MDKHPGGRCDCQGAISFYEILLQIKTITKYKSFLNVAVA